MLIITKAKGNIGGLARYSQALAHSLQERGASVRLLSENAADGASLFPIDGSLLKKVLLIIGNCIITRIASRQIAIVHALDGWPYSIYAYAAVVGTRKHLFITGVGTYTLRPLRHHLLGVLFRKIYDRADRVFAISRYVRDGILARAPQARVDVVHLGVATLPALSSGDEADFERTYRLGNSYPLILTVGDIKDRKGQLDTLKAILLLEKEYPNIRYVVIGTDTDIHYVAQMKLLATSHGQPDVLHIISNNYDDRILSYFYDHCDVYALNSTNSPSFFEGFGLTIIEAASFGTPAVGSSNCGIEDAILDGITGYLTKERDPMDIADKIRLILTHKHVNFQKSAIKFSQGFSWDKMGRQYITAYNDVLARPPK